MAILVQDATEDLVQSGVLNHVCINEMIPVKKASLDWKTRRCIKAKEGLRGPGGLGGGGFPGGFRR